MFGQADGGACCVQSNGDEIMTKQVIIILIIILSLSIITLYFSFRSNADEIKLLIVNNQSGDSNKNASIMNNALNRTNNTTENNFLIKLEKPPDEVIGG
jgi:hypothetical protein